MLLLEVRLLLLAEDLLFFRGSLPAQKITLERSALLLPRLKPAELFRQPAPFRFQFPSFLGSCLLYGCRQLGPTLPENFEAFVCNNGISRLADAFEPVLFQRQGLLGDFAPIDEESGLTALVFFLNRDALPAEFLGSRMLVA